MFRNPYFQKTYSRSAIWLIGFFCLWNLVSLKTYQRPDAIRHDMLAYYGYLPAYFIHDDLSLAFVDDSNRYHYNWTIDAPNGRVFKMTMGVALLNTPFFLVADTVSQLFGLNRTGFSSVYYFFIALSAIFYFVKGLSLLQKSLAWLFDRGTALWVILILAFGTNLYYYTFDEFEMSHVYNFFLFSLLLRYTIRWHHQPTKGTSIMMGIALGLLTLIRPIHAMAVLFPLLYSPGNFRDKLRQVSRHYLLIFLIALTAFTCLLPQLLYWKSLSGQWLFYSYGNERFYFNDPKIVEGLFGFRKGWIIYTPVMAFSIIGFISLYRFSRNLFLSVFSYFILYCLVVFSWWCWWYGGSFGSRPMIDILPLMALPLGAFIYRERNQRRLPRMLLPLAFVFFIFLNIFQTRQYRSTLLHWDSMNYNLYREIFLSKKFPEQYEQKLTPPDYESAMEGRER